MAELTRRDFLAGAAAAAGALATGAGRAEAATSAFDGTIRVANLGIELIEPIRKRAERDLGLKIVSSVASLDSIRAFGRQQPGAFDIFAGWQGVIDELWPTGNFQPLEIARIERWRREQGLERTRSRRPDLLTGGEER